MESLVTLIVVVLSSLGTAAVALLAAKKIAETITKGPSKLYVVEMLKGGSREAHSYVEGVYKTAEEAEEAAQQAEKGRRKYRANIISYYVGEGTIGAADVKTAVKVAEGE